MKKLITITFAAALILTQFDGAANATIFRGGVVGSVLNRVTNSGYRRGWQGAHVGRRGWNRGGYYWSHGSHGSHGGYSSYGSHGGWGH